jgi:uncharacterized membrane protein YkvA (DUF1232 family)
MDRFATPLGILVLGLIYFVWPVDLIPDVFGPVGHLDDLAVALLVAWRLMVAKRKASHTAAEDGESEETSDDSAKRD